MAEEMTLLIMAAGMGSRYGGMKQIDHVDDDNDKIIDFSIYDAAEAGFDKVVLIIKKENRELFDREIKDRVGDRIKIEYAYQELGNIPANAAVYEERQKPWGTAHAVLSARDIISGPFAVINADDFYGRDAFEKAAAFLSGTGKGHYAMVAYDLMNTLTENGTVSRGVCNVSEDGFLMEVTERTNIRKTDNGAEYEEDDGASWIGLEKDAAVSMNFWCFASDFMGEAERCFEYFYRNELPSDPLKKECYLPSVVSDLLSRKLCDVKVLRTAGVWHGVTYKEDKAGVISAIKELKDSGIYPQKLWGHPDMIF